MEWCGGGASAASLQRDTSDATAGPSHDDARESEPGTVDQNNYICMQAWTEPLISQQAMFHLSLHAH